MSSERVLVIEADAEFARALEATLRGAKLDSFVVRQGEVGLDLAMGHAFAAVLVALDLPDLHGHEVLRRLRGAGEMVPVLMLTKDDAHLEARVQSFVLGADDVIARSCHPQEIQARVKAFIRRTKDYAANTIQVGTLLVDRGRRQAKVRGTDVALTGKEFDILEHLVLRRGRILSKESILQGLYAGTTERSGRILDVFLCRLRAKLTDAGARTDLIETVRGSSYRLNAAPVVATVSRRPVA